MQRESECSPANDGVVAAVASDWHLREAANVARKLAVELHRGLPEDEAVRRAARHGPNELAAGARRSPWRLLLEQFTDFMFLVLLGAAVLSGLIGELADTLAILVIVALDGVVGFVQAWRASA